MKEWLKRFFGSTREEVASKVNEYDSLSLPEGSADELAQRALKTWKSGDHQTALALYSDALKLSPDDGTLYLNRGNLKMELELIDDAIADLEWAVSLDPQLPAVNLGLLKMMKENPNLLKSFLRKQRAKLDNGLTSAWRATSDPVLSETRLQHELLWFNHLGALCRADFEVVSLLEIASIWPWISSN